MSLPLLAAAQPMHPRDYQELACNAVWHALRTIPGSHPVVVMPTGTGKSLVIGWLCTTALRTWPTARIMVLTHVKELIEQNAEKLLRLWPSAPLGINSAGLARRDMFHPIMYGGVQTVKNCIDDFGRIDLLFIDEAHLLSPNAETSYRFIIERLMVKNPHLRVVGFTATDYRQGQGRIWKGEGALFNCIAIDMTSMDWFAWFIAHGHLVPPIPKRTENTYDMASVSIVNGDYNLAQMNAIVDEDKLNRAVCAEMVQHWPGHHAGIVFASGIDHADNLSRLLNTMGLRTFAVHNKVDKKDRAEALRALQGGALDMLTNNNVLTTGVDVPELDFIGMCRATVSTSLWVQMLGRGTRPASWINKQGCLVLDFAGNTKRLGPINDPVIPKEKGKGGGEAPVKLCDACGCYNHASARECKFCFTPFDIKPKLTELPSYQELYRGATPEYEFFNVMRVFYIAHTARKTGEEIIRVSYMCGNRQFSEFHNFEAHHPYVRTKAKNWWLQMVGDHYTPETNKAALQYLTTYGTNMTPSRIKVHVNKTLPDVVAYEFL